MVRVLSIELELLFTWVPQIINSTLNPRLAISLKRGTPIFGAYASIHCSVCGINMMVPVRSIELVDPFLSIEHVPLVCLKFSITDMIVPSWNKQILSETIMDISQRMFF